VDERLLLAEELHALAEEHDLVVHRLLAAQMWCTAAAARLDVAGVRRRAAAARAVAETYDVPHSIDQLDALRACLLAVEGRAAEAAALYAATAAAMTAHGSYNAEALGAVGHVALAIDARDAASLLPVAQGLHAAMGPTLADLHALALAWSGQPERAREVRAEVVGEVVHEFWWGFHSAVRVLATLATGELDEAEHAAGLLTPYAGTVAGLSTNCVAIGPVAQLLGDVEVALGRTGPARERYAQALQVARAVRAPLWTERAGAALVGVGGDPAAVAAPPDLPVPVRPRRTGEASVPG
jgi:hypothetical protein